MDSDQADLVRAEAATELVTLEGDEAFPAHPEFPAVLHRAALRLPRRGDAAGLIEQLFAGHGWTGSWRDTVYDFPHYHSNAHEVLGCFAGEATLQLGGPAGPTLRLSEGDVLVMPAGTAHCRLRASETFQVVGAYDGGVKYDMCRAAVEDMARTRARIRSVPRPEQDPVFGTRARVSWLGGRSS